MWKKISVVIDIILVLLIIFVGYVQIEMLVTRGNNHGVPKVFGQSILYVGTNSMDDGTSHGIPPGTAVIINTVSPSSIKASTPIYDEVDKTKIIDYEKDTGKLKEHNSICPSCPTFEEAKLECERVLDEYNSHGHYVRNVKSRRFVLEHELIEKDIAKDKVNVELTPEQYEVLKGIFNGIE